MLPLKNRCFALLPEHAQSILRRKLTLTEVPKGTRLSTIVREPTLIFPITSVFAVTATSADQNGLFLRFSGTGSVLGAVSERCQKTIQYEGTSCVTGYILSLPSANAWDLLESPMVLQAATYKFLSAITKRALCCAFCASNHSISQRLATLLLAAGDEFGSDRLITLTQEELSRWLFVRRESVASLLAEWSAAGVIETGRAKIHIRDRAGLLNKACACYQNAASLSAQEFDSWAGLSWKNESFIETRRGNSRVLSLG